MIEKQINSRPSDSTEPKTRSGWRTSTRSSPELILVVDDDPNIRESLAEVLRTENYAVRLAGDGYEALRQVLQGPPDLILLDINMPSLSGWQVFDTISGLYPQVPVIIITARPGQATRAAQAGIEMLLEKPLDIPVLLQAIRRLLDQPDIAHLERVLGVWPTRDHLGSQE